MLEGIIKRFRQGNHGISSIIVIMLSLILIVVVVANVVLWGYEMNQLDWERMQEKIEVTDAKCERFVSAWLVVDTEYAIYVGSRVSGSYLNTHSIEDGIWETFQEELSPAPERYRLFINGNFSIDISSYPLNTIETVEILLKYNVSDTEEKWYLKAYNWTAQEYSHNGFNNTSGNQPSISGAWIHYTVNLTDTWRSYVNDNGVILVQLHEGTLELPSGTQTRIGVDFLGIRIKGDWTSFTFSNEGSLTAHIVSLWIINSSHHTRYNIDFFVNSGESTTYARPDVCLPPEDFLVKIVTERGNTAVFASH